MQPCTVHALETEGKEENKMLVVENIIVVCTYVNCKYYVPVAFLQAY